MEPIDYLDGFSGYGGFHKGLEEAGVKFRNVYYSEIDKHAVANYSYNFPKSIYVGSITDVSRREIPELDLFTFGWPCQDNSIAGKRKGQSEGTRSGLLHQAVRILNELKPRNFIAENVLGLLSVNEGIDIIKSLELLAYHNWQHVVYPYCIHQNTGHQSLFTYLITDFKEVYDESYQYKAERDEPRLRNICEELIEFLETYRHLVTDLKVFAQEPMIAEYDNEVSATIVSNG